LKKRRGEEGILKGTEEIIMGGGLIGLLVLAADIYAILNIFQSRDKDGPKVLWAIGVLLFPLAGAIVWYFVGPKKK
jgi:hypothetical protein